MLNRTWALDCMCDTFYDSRRYRILNVIDEGNREALAIGIAISLPAVWLVALPEQLAAVHGHPRALRLDNGPKLTSDALATWCEEHGVASRFIQSGKPQQHTFMERFNRTCRTEVLDTHVLTYLEDVRTISDDFFLTCNTEWPHDSLGRVPPHLLANAKPHGGVCFSAVCLTGELP